ncbi:MAG TPA: DUF2007 domain-containing protein, partial [Kofleriaceae bacterium]|nr:DUF2007 domain-containing protein [Kofleriaceae bacterium]
MGRVRIGTCSGPAEAVLVRAAFDAHDIHVVINAEHHASVLGGLGGAFVPLHIMVDEADAEEAAALLADLRQHDRAQAGDHPEGELEDAAAPSDEDEDEDDAGSGRASDVGQRVDRRRRTGIALLLGLCATFGTAHMSTGAWLRGLVLAGVELFAIKRMITGADHAWPVLLAVIAADVIGAVWRIHSPPTRIPP